MFKKLLVLALVCLGLTAFSIPPKLEKKMNKAIVAYFEIEEFSKELVEVSNDNDATVPATFKENLYAIKDASGLLGYAYLGNAPSKTATFDYLILFDADFIILKSKVLIYREEYGGEIGSKRWLKQFIGKSSKDSSFNEKDVHAISGATISVRSMTLAINDVLQSISVLQANDAF